MPPLPIDDSWQGHALAVTNSDASSGSLEQRCLELGKLLGLDGPVPLQVLKAALTSDSYARGLLRSRRSPAALAALLATPPQDASDTGSGTCTEDDRHTPHFSALELARHSAGALLAWSRTRFATTDPDERQQRISACLACPQRLAPKTITGDGRETQELGVCGLCGCPLSRKVAMRSETCPAHSLETPGRNRWGQQLVSPPHPTVQRP
ncbi:hypothetical protein NFI08_15920 [Halomonas sp. EF61]|uniref:hypothetical protein n=1 Tax=Halomonas sp. EF61 TaxID=2950869 RepID=UPI0032DF0FB0